MNQYVNDLEKGITEKTAKKQARNIITQNKFERNILQIISDSLSRLLNNLRTTHCIGVYFDLKNENYLLRINICPKKKPDRTFEEDIKKTLKSFYRQEYVFICDGILRKMKDFAKSFSENNSNSAENIQKASDLCHSLQVIRENDNCYYNGFFQNYISFILSISNVLTGETFNDLQYIRIIISDILFLKINFKAQFTNIKDYDDIIIKIFEKGNKVHPDSKLAFEFRNSNENNNYIGVSQLCSACSLILDSHGFYFSGIL